MKSLDGKELRVKGPLLLSQLPVSVTSHLTASENENVGALSSLLIKAEVGNE